MLKCTINGVELEVKEGTSIIQAMYDNSQKIAHYCWHPGLSIAGVCRLCMVEIEGNPRLQIACNTQVIEGMKINNTSSKVQEAVKWGLDFHLINHPLDCPVCDQAGECGLQDQYMEFGQYTSEMAEPKQKKHKVVDLGPTVVLDSERCILCSRCVRFTDEVSKTNELGIFNRGDHAEIGTHDGKQLNNPYSLNTVDICPVGALTSKDFRFKQRAWYLKDSETVCNGCSTGCNVKVYYNKEGLFRVKPKYNADVNGHWMCDEGRNTYKFVNKESRLEKARIFKNGIWEESGSAGASTKQLYKHLEMAKPEEIGLVLTGQLTNEEYDSILNTFVNTFKTKNVYHWFNHELQKDTFDGILIRGDKNPNTKGLQAAFSKHGINTTWSDLESKLNLKQIKYLVVFGPENTAVYNDIDAQVNLFTKAAQLAYFTSAQVASLKDSKNIQAGSVVIPLKTFVEKSGSFTNHAGKVQAFKKATTIISDALNVNEVAQLLAGHEIQIQFIPAENLFIAENLKSDQVRLEHRKKNEFLFNKG
ncbi:MAG: (2Fe-2S)-binding protein [Bdellovibrionaceae bacterium]|nr:(2Fe-2S)-binding protein [Pseudobdellovibrionaceae bacterium]